MNKITIIGAGSVGSTIAYTLMVKGTAAEIIMIDVNKEKAVGEALDIRQGAPFSAACNIHSGDYCDAVGSDIVILSSGIARRPGQSRLDLAQTNVNITKSIIPEITRYAPDAVYIIVSNPVDILTYTFHKCSGLPENQIIGSGTILDTSRLRSRLSEIYRISPQNINGYVFGEHGDSSFVPWSNANIANIPALDYPASIPGLGLPAADPEEVERYVHEAGGQIIERKGATFYAVSVAVCHICQCILNGLNTTMTVSTMMHGEYGVDDVCLSVLNLVGREGVKGKIDLKLTDEEIARLHKSADALKDVLKNLDI